MRVRWSKADDDHLAGYIDSVPCRLIAAELDRSVARRQRDVILRLIREA